MSGPTFLNATGQPVNSIVCGNAYTFDVPGYNEVWLEQSKNGAFNFAGPFPVPMPSYIADCMTEVGTYGNVAYELVGGKKGALIGQAMFQVFAGGPEIVHHVPAPAGALSFLTGLPWWAWAAIAGGVLLMMGGGKGGGRRAASDDLGI